ncbi:MAG: murein L,D-transpeptidase, partial [Hyphomicrobiaceae bacterium]|nr:murein L,D-transpeptidase [Hyphomicrobiaceae bacterium]
MRGVAVGKPVRWVLAVAAAAGALSACATLEMPPAHLMPLPKETVTLLGKKHMEMRAPIFIRIYKEESELEVWKMRDDGRFYHLKTFPICNWSGRLGPKLHQGDRQSPEGFYTITKEQMNPNSSYHLAFNLGFPNPYDRSNKRTGEFLMVHGGCGSSGCYAMTDALMEELYALMREAFNGGQTVVHVHAYPFRMTNANMAAHSKSEWQSFWRTLKEGHDYFELTRQVPTIAVCNRHYVVNVRMANGDASKLDPAAACPAFEHPRPNPFTPKPGEFAEERVVVPGEK